MEATKPLTKKAEKAQERAKAIERLREWLPPGSTVYTVLGHVSRSGMQREIKAIVKLPNEVLDVSWLVARAIDHQLGTRGVVMGGCGMDMGFHLVYTLSATLYHGKAEDGKYRSSFACTGIVSGPGRCPSNDHVNPGPERDNYATDHMHSDGGYALRHSWL